MEAVLPHKLLRIVRTVLAATVRVVEAELGMLADRHSHLQRTDCAISFHPIADRSGKHTPWFANQK